MLEFDCEVALFVNTVRSIEKKFGKDLTLLDFDDAYKFKPDIKRTLSDIKIVREDDGVAPEEAGLKDKKLVVGLLSVVLGQTFRELGYEPHALPVFTRNYPPFDWTLLLTIIKICRWEDHLIQCMKVLHIEVLMHVTQVLFDRLRLPSLNLPLCIRIVPVFLHPVKITEALTMKKSEVQYQDFVKRLVDAIDAEVHVVNEWSFNSKAKVVALMLHGVAESCSSMWYDFECNPIYRCNADAASDEIVAVVSCENLGTLYYKVLERSEHLNPVFVENDVNVDTFCVFCDWCLRTLTSPAFELFTLLTSDATSSNNDAVWEIKSVLKSLDKCREELKSSDESDSLAVKRVVKTLMSLKQRAESFFVQSLPSSSTSSLVMSLSNDMMDAIRRRHFDFREHLSYVIRHPELIHMNEWISCLEENVAIIDKNDSHQLLRQLNEGNLQFPNAEKIKLVIVNAVLTWPKIMQEQFIVDYLDNSDDVLETSTFKQDLTLFFNTFSKGNASLDETMLRNFRRLCLQSVTKTFVGSILLAINNYSQVDIFIKLFASVPFLCTYKRASSNHDFLCERLRSYVTSQTLSDTQVDNLLMFIVKLLKAKGRDSLNPSKWVPVLEPLDLFQCCVLPFLDKWMPGTPSMLHFALLLFQNMIEGVSKAQCLWLSKLRPCIILCYLCLIVYECKLVSTTCLKDWVPIKRCGVAIVQKIIHWMVTFPELSTDMEMKWLLAKIQNVHEPAMFYLVDLLEFHNYPVSFAGTDEPLVHLLEFGLCNEKNAMAVQPWYLEITRGLRANGWAQVISALVKVLPACLMSEWRNVVKILKHCFENHGLTLHRELVFTFYHSKDYESLLGLFCILEKVVVLCSALNDSISHMLHCFATIVKEQVEEDLSENGEDQRFQVLVAEEFVRTCSLVKRFSPVYDSDGGNLLIVLSQTALKLGRQNKKVIAAMREAYCSVPSFQVQTAIAKILI